MRALRTVEDIMGDIADNTAADRKVRLQAATAMLGEEAKGPLVNVNVGGGANVQQAIGYVIDLRPDPPEDAPRDVTPPTIDLAPVRPR